MKRSGPQFATIKDKDGNITPSLPPRVRRPNPIPQGSSIIDRLKRCKLSEAAHLRREGLSYTNASRRTLHRILQLT